MKVRVSRAFYFEGEPQAVGEVIDLPGGLARSLMQAGKVSPVREVAERAVLPEPETRTETEGERAATPEGEAPTISDETVTAERSPTSRRRRRAREEG